MTWWGWLLLGLWGPSTLGCAGLLLLGLFLRHRPSEDDDADETEIDLRVAEAPRLRDVNDIR